MPKPKHPLTPLELEIMKVLWETGPANVQTVQQTLERPLAYTTVQTMLNVLHRKGHVKRSLKQKAYFYRPALSRADVVKQTMTDVLDRLFSGSASSMMMTLLKTKQLSQDELARVRAMLDEADDE